MSQAQITVIIPLYFAADKVSTLLEIIARQKNPFDPKARQADWMEVLFIDNASTDTTVAALQTAIEKNYPDPTSRSHLRIEVNEKNLGLSRSLNKAFSLTRTPFALTCHSDCRFGQEDYVARMLDLLIRHPDAGAITGQTSIDPGKQLPLTEKVNLVTNLMDLFPPLSRDEVVPVGFAEGRCDGFRLEALRAAGFYDTSLKLAGEDQVLAAAMRAHSYEIYQAPSLIYYLSVSIQQDTLNKLARHQQRFGRAHPYILLLNRGAHQGAISKSAGTNRKSRTLLRLTQLLSCGLYLTALALIIKGHSWPMALSALIIVLSAKLALFAKHLRVVRFSPVELLVFFLYQPVLDFAYTIGVAQGLWLLTQSSQKREIG
jgi:glycosyltransferase involved in cell wall biosynthesis